MHSEIVSTDALLFRVLAAPDYFLSQPQIWVAQSPLEPFPMALKPLNQAAILGVDTDTALSQVKPVKEKV